MNAITQQQAGAVLEQVIIGGDLSRLQPEQRVVYYKQVCDSIGLNPLTKPFEYITLNGKLTLYALRSCTEQLRQINGVSVIIVSRELVEDCYIVTAKAVDKTGRSDESIGAVPIGGLKGEARSNAMMKAETKAKRRVTLSICGLGLLDETEVSSIPGAKITPTTGALAELTAERQSVVMEVATQVKALLTNDQAADAYAIWQNSRFDADNEVAFWSLLPSDARSALTRLRDEERTYDKGVISQAQHKRLEARIKELKIDRDALKEQVKAKYGIDHFTELSREQYQELDQSLSAAGAVSPAPLPTLPSAGALINDVQESALIDMLEFAGVPMRAFFAQAKIKSMRELKADRFDGAIKWIKSQQKVPT